MKSMLGKKVKALREMRGLSQNELAKRVGVKQATLSRLESGIASQMKSEALAKLAESLGVTSDFLLGKTEKVKAEDILEDDVDAKKILEGYISMSLESKKKLLDYCNYLVQNERKSEGGSGARKT